MLSRVFRFIIVEYIGFEIKCALRESIHKRFVTDGVDLPIPIRKVVRED